MKFINITTQHSPEELVNFISDNDRVSSGVKFNDKKGGRPYMHVKQKGDRLRIKCEMVGRPSKDNGFLMGTMFFGRVSERDGQTTLKGVITTSPFYHIGMLALVIVMIVQSIVTLSPYSIPLIVFAIAFEFLFFGDEFKKQGYISRYLERAVRRMDSRN